MNFKIMLGIVFFLLFVTSVSAVDISDCLKILDDNNNQRIWLGQVSGEDQQSFSNCVVQVAIAKNDPSVCKEEYEKYKIQKINPYPDAPNFIQHTGYTGFDAERCQKLFSLGIQALPKTEKVKNFDDKIKVCDSLQPEVNKKICIAGQAIDWADKTGDDSFCRTKSFSEYIVFPAESPGGSQSIYDGPSYQKKCLDKAEQTRILIQCSQEMYIPNTDNIFGVIEKSPQQVKDKCVVNMKNVQNPIRLCEYITDKLSCIKVYSPQERTFKFMDSITAIYMFSNNLINIIVFIVLSLAIFIGYLFSRSLTNEKLEHFLFCIFISSIVMLLFIIIPFSLSLTPLIVYVIAHLINNLTFARIVSGIIFVLINAFLAYFISMKYKQTRNLKKTAILTIIIFNIIITVIMILLLLFSIGEAIS